MMADDDAVVNARPNTLFGSHLLPKTATPTIIPPHYKMHHNSFYILVETVIARMIIAEKMSCDNFYLI